MRALACLLLPPLAILSCRSLPAGHLPRPRIEVTPRTGEKPHRISVAAVAPDHPNLRQALEVARVGLRIAGEREGLVLRYAALDPAAESVLLRSLAIGSAFSRPAAFGETDAIEVRALTSPPESRGFILHLVPRPRLAGLDVGVIARPPNGALLPVIRGTVPIPGTVSLLLTGEAEGRRAFVAILRLTLRGASRVGSVSEPRSHRLTIEAFAVPDAALSRILRRLSREERGGEGGIAEYLILARELPGLRKYLRAEGDVLPQSRHSLGPGREARWVRGALRLSVSTRFSLADFSYETQVTRRPPRKVNHGEGDAILVVGWDAERPGSSLAAVLSLRPEE